MYQLFSRQVTRVGEQDAVRDQRGTVTYTELSRRVDVLVTAIREQCPGTGERIGLHLGRTADLVAAVLAVSASGHVYVLLDPAYPAERLQFMAADSGLSVILSDRGLPEGLRAVPVLRVDRVDWSQHALKEPAVDVDASATAYVIYTSGSTGRPKGVEVRRRSVVALIDAVCSRHEFTDRDVWTLFHSSSFDFSVWEMWGALATGATLVVVPVETALSPRATAELLVRERVTVMNIVPSVFRYLTAALRQLPDRPVTVRRIMFGGEAVDVADIRSWRETVGTGCEFINTYGITETTVFVSTRLLRDDELDSRGDDREFGTDLGVPLDGWEIQVVDESGVPVEKGQTGEIWVAGEGVAVGYLNQPDLTAERFRWLALPGRATQRFYRSGDLAARTANDVFCYAGRADGQVKINGFRIELGDVEATLRRISGVLDLAVVRTRSRVGGYMLTAYYTLESDCPPLDIAGQARTMLPKHMVPGRFVPLPELPRNPSGKTDRKALAESLSPATAPAPRSPG
jgi:amino acid adenylation domain-containing protein